MDLYKNIGNYRHYTNCRFCFKKLLKPVINLGQMPLAGGFLKSANFIDEKFYPLELSFCLNCFLLQSINVIDKNTLFKNYFYLSSKIKTLVSYFNQIAFSLKNSFKNPKENFIVEIGCNDGILLEKLLSSRFKILGVDPAQNIVNSVKNKKIRIIKSYFTESLAKKVLKKYGKANAIVSFNTFAHIEDMHDVMRGIKYLLKKDGFLEFGVHYLGEFIEKRQFDMVYHEHQYYYSVIALKNFLALYNMEIYDIKQTNIHAGSIVIFAQDKDYGKRKITKNVQRIIDKEIKIGLNKAEIYKSLMESVKNSKIELLKILKKIKAKNKKIAGYGASGRGTIIMSYSNLTNELLDYVVDDSPIKQGAYTPGNHLKIYSSSKLYSRNKPDYVLVFAWAFIDEIKKRHKKFIQDGGKLIVPLPKVKVISQ